MIPSRIFRSRWSALFWSAGIVWTAYDVAMANRSLPKATPATNSSSAAPDQDATGDAVDAHDLSILANAGR